MKFVKKIIKIILIIILIFCIFKIIYKKINYYKDNTNNKEIQNIMKDNNTVKSQEKLLKINNEYKCWIYIPGTKVNYPVVQTNNNSYYLNHNFKKDRSIGGTLFIYDKYNWNLSKNMIIFGHDMRNKSMFGTLNLFKNKEFFDKNKYIYIIKGEKKYKYEIIGASIMNANSQSLMVDFYNENQLKKYIINIKKKACNWRRSYLNNDSKILTLSTCSYEFKDARLIIIAKILINTKKVKSIYM